jgi:hyaluronoglucosaminidase
MTLLALTGGAQARAGSALALPAIYPVPKSMSVRPGQIAISGSATVVTTVSSDAPAVALIRRVLASTGATGVRVTTTPPALTKRGVTVYVGRNRAAEQALRVSGASGLPTGGYVLAAGSAPGGRGLVVLDGADGAGQFYAAQTLRQLLAQRSSLRDVVIRDWPSFASRGVVEGFYGTPWSFQERLATLDFLGAHKLNLYMYAPKDDPGLRATWQAPDTPSELHELQMLVDRAKQNHVTFNFAISPGLSVCYSSVDDETKLIQKLTAVWNLGVRSFTVAFDDIDPTQLNCDADRARFGYGSSALASAQAYLLNEIDTNFVGAHAGAMPLITVPTEYYGLAATPYQLTLASSLNSNVVVQLTGPYGVSTTITSGETSAAKQLYGHPVLLWDNLFVNDYAPGQLVLGAYSGRDRTLPSAAVGVAIDPMDQPESSKIGLFTAADYTWNPTAYDPARSWDAALRELAGGDAKALSALHTFADANYACPVDPLHAPLLMNALTKFWQQWYVNLNDTSAATPLAALFHTMQDAPAVIRARVPDPAFIAEVSPWLDATATWGQAGVAAVDLLVARRTGDQVRAAADEQTVRTLRTQAQSIVWNGTTPPTPVQVAGDSISVFVHDALRGYGP